MIFDCTAAGDFVSQHVDCFVIDVEGFVVWALEVPQLRVLCGLGLKVLGVHSWLILLITIPVLFSMFFFIFANGAMQSP